MIQRGYGLIQNITDPSALGKIELTGEMSWGLFLALIRAESGNWLKVNTRILGFGNSEIMCL